MDNVNKLGGIAKGLLACVGSGYKEVMEEKCLECNENATYIRHTQFAGDHPYCEHHAKKEDDFGENDSYTYWTRVKETK